MNKEYVFIGGRAQGKTRDLIQNLISENKQLKEQLEYLRSGEYLNQLTFERNMLQDLVDSGEISKEDKEFIDMTHRNTELLEQLKQRDEVIDEAIKLVKKYCVIFDGMEDYPIDLHSEQVKNLFKILQKYKGD